MLVYFFTGTAAIGSVAFDIASTRFPEHDWRKLVLATPEDRRAFEAQEHAPDLILSFLNPYIIPARHLDAVGGRAYNVHPSPPDQPGNDPAHFLFYRGKRTAGATLHVMDAKVDAGTIMATTEVDLGPDADLPRLREFSTHLSLSVLLEHLPALLEDTLEPSGDEWVLENKRSRADFIEMCRIDPGIDADELQRRLDAFHHPGFRNQPFVELHGRTFVYDPER